MRCEDREGSGGSSGRFDSRRPVGPPGFVVFVGGTPPTASERRDSPPAPGMTPAGLDGILAAAQERQEPELLPGRGRPPRGPSPVPAFRRVIRPKRGQAVDVSTGMPCRSPNLVDKGAWPTAHRARILRLARRGPEPPGQTGRCSHRQAGPVLVPERWPAQEVPAVPSGVLLCPASGDDRTGGAGEGYRDSRASRVTWSAVRARPLPGRVRRRRIARGRPGRSGPPAQRGGTASCSSGA
jgi:hypothetical protein